MPHEKNTKIQPQTKPHSKGILQPEAKQQEEEKLRGEEDPIFENLNAQQVPAVRHFTGPALVVAGPGSGKTRVLTKRVANLIKHHNVPEMNILCVTFTNKAAKEIEERTKSTLSELNLTIPKLPWSGTFHSVCSKILRKDGRNIGLPPGFVIYDSDDQKSLIKQICKDFGIDPKKFNPRAILGTISNNKSELITPEDFQTLAYGYYQKTVAKVYPEYQRRLRKNNALDFDDLLVETVNLFSQAPQILEKYQNLFQFILVDEYQDTNRAQYVITKLLANSHRNIFVVGDMSQAIYSFRGADYRNILNFQKDYPEAIVYNLERNYRSTQNILSAATAIIKNNSSHIALELWTQNGSGEKIISYTGRSEKDEANFVVEEILHKTENSTKEREFDFKDIAVLYRTNAQSRTIEEALIRNNIPYRIVGGQRFYARKEVKDMIAYLRVIHNPKDSVSWARIINTPPRGIGKKSVEKLQETGWNLTEITEKTKLPFDLWVSQSSDLATIELLDAVIDKTGYIDWLDDGSEENKARIENIMELRSVASQFTDLEDFLENVALIESSDSPAKEEQNCVTLMTIHASKGLEFGVVFIVGMEEGLFPHAQSMMELSELEEERRLCYVAITRAKNLVFLCKAQNRLYFGNAQSNIPSRFLGEIPQDLIAEQGNFSATGSLGSLGSLGANLKYGRTDKQQNPQRKGEVERFLDEMDYDRSNFSW